MSSSPNVKFSAPIDLGRVRQLFDSPQRVAESNFLRREVAARMCERLQLVKIDPSSVLDAGCGEGADLSLLQNQYGKAYVLGLDAAPAMLIEAQRQQIAALSSMNRLLAKWLPASLGVGQSAGLVAADFSQLPLPAQAVELVWSNLALHWHPQPDRVFAEWRRVLRVDGLLMFSCFGPDTFKELRAAFSGIDAAAHALPFVDMHDLGDMLVDVGFSTPVMDMEVITVTYASAEKLLDDVRAWGGNPLMTRRTSMMGRRSWTRVCQALDAMRRPDGLIALTFELIYGHAFRPESRVTAAGETIIRLDLKSKREG